MSVSPDTLSRPRRRVARAFTLIELIVVIVVLSVVAGIAAPRLLNSSSRRAQSEVRQIAELLSAAARRDGSGGGLGEAQRVVFDADKGVLSLEVRRARAGEQDAGAWREDPLVAPVNLENVRLERAVVDGVNADERGWRLDLAPGRVRPTIELVFVADQAGGKARRTGSAAPARPAANAERWNVLLLSYAAGAEIAGVGGAGAALRSVDLDATGMGDKPW